MRILDRPALQLFALAVLVHAGLSLFVVLRTGRIDTYALRSLDCGEYHAIARNVAEHGVFSQSDEPPSKPDTWRTPGYPLFLAPFMIVLGDSPAMLVVVQQVLSVVSVWLLFLIARRWMSDRRALLVAALFLLEPYRLYYSLWLMSTTLFVAILLTAWLVWQRAIQTRRWGWFALLGALGGYVVLVRPGGGLIPVVLLAGLVVLIARRPAKVDEGRVGTAHHEQSAISRQPGWPALPAFVITCALIVGSWMTRNQTVAGHFALSDQAGVVLAYFKATEVVLWREGRTPDRYLETTLDPASRDLPHSVWDRIDTRLRQRLIAFPKEQRDALRWENLAQGNRTTADSFVVSAALQDVGWSYLSASPVSTAMCYLVRCGSILTFPLNLALQPPKGADVPRTTAALKGSVFLLLCVWVLVRLFRRGLAFDQVYFPLACAIALLLLSTPQIDPRFRVPIIPLLLVIASMPRLTPAPGALPDKVVDSELQDGPRTSR